MIKPTELLKCALEKEQQERDYPVSHYAETIYILRKKGFTWRECVNFFKEKGLDFSRGQLSTAYHHSRYAMIEESERESQ